MESSHLCHTMSTMKRLHSFILFTQEIHNILYLSLVLQVQLVADQDHVHLLCSRPVSAVFFHLGYPVVQSVKTTPLCDVEHQYDTIRIVIVLWHQGGRIPELLHASCVPYL